MHVQNLRGQFEDIGGILKRELQILFKMPQLGYFYISGAQNFG